MYLSQLVALKLSMKTKQLINKLKLLFLGSGSSNAVVASPDKYYVIGKGSVLHPEAEIVNNLRDKSRILIGDNVHVRGQILTFAHGGKVQIGSYCYIGRNTYIWSARSIIIGNRVLISHNCNIFDNDTHPINPVHRHEQFKNIITAGHPGHIDLHEEDVVINDDVLIAANAIILKGVTIGKGAIISAGSVVTKNVDPFTIVAGNPALIIRVIPEDDRA